MYCFGGEDVFGLCDFGYVVGDVDCGVELVVVVGGCWFVGDFDVYFWELLVFFGYGFDELL